MAKFIEEKDIINNHINSFVERITDYSKYLEGSPSFVTYYSKDVLASTADIGLGSVHELVGNESPIKYNKINNVPIYNIEELTPSQDYDEELGLDTNIEGTGIILSDIGFKPLVDDFLIISYDKRKILFKINDIELSNINDRVLYKITYHYASESLDLLELQITQEYETKYDNLGSNSKQSKIVIEKEIYEYIENLETLRNKILNTYVESFYNKKVNTFIYTSDEGGIIHDNLLSKFIMDHRLFINKKTFLKNIFIEPTIPFDRISNRLYRDSLYYNIANKKSIDKLILNYSIINLAYPKFSIWDINKTRLNADLYSIMFINIENDKLNTLISNDSIEYRIITNFLNNPMDKSNSTNIYNDILLINDYEDDSIKNYIILPIIIYIIEYLINFYETKN